MTSSKGVDIRNGPPRMPNNVLFKLFGFTILLFLAPILSFFGTKNYFFTKNAEVYSGIIAVVMVNLVILVYILLIFNDEEEEEMETDKKKKMKDEKYDESSNGSSQTAEKKEKVRKRKV